MLRERYRAAQTADEFVARAETNGHLWRSIHQRATAPADLVERAARLPAPRHLLVLLEEWCGDAVNTVPVLARLADAVPQLDLRVLPRDENPDLMDSHLSDGARAIPVVMVLDEEYEELGWWGSRPRELQAWVSSPGARELAPADRYREVRRWYARDRGRSALEEVLALLEHTAAGQPA